MYKRWQHVLLVVAALFVITVSWLFLSGHFINCGMDGGKSDWVTNCRMMQAYEKGNLDNALYRDYVYPFYPFKEMIVVYAGFVLPLLLVFYSWKSGANAYAVLFFYFASMSPLAYICKGYMKQLLFDMLLVFFLIVYYGVKEWGFFTRLSTIGVFLVLASEWGHGFVRRVLNPFGFSPGYLWHNIPFTAVAGVYFAVVGFVQMAWEREWLLFLFALPFAWVGMGDSRAYSSLFFLQLPFIARFIEWHWKKWSGGLSE